MQPYSTMVQPLRSCGSNGTGHVRLLPSGRYAVELQIGISPDRRPEYWRAIVGGSLAYAQDIVFQAWRYHELGLLEHTVIEHGVLHLTISSEKAAAITARQRVKVTDVADLFGQTQQRIREVLHDSLVGTHYLDRDRLWSTLLVGTGADAAYIEKLTAAPKVRSNNWRNKVEPNQRLRIEARDGPFCRYCNRRVARSSYQLDHIIPICKGGATIDENLVVSCIPCNSTKRGKHLEEVGMSLLPLPNRKRRAQWQD